MVYNRLKYKNFVKIYKLLINYYTDRHMREGWDVQNA